MKKLLGILVLCLFLITPSQADDIRDFQIEGMSIGDSLLDYISEEEIKNSPVYDHTNSGFTSKKMYQLRKLNSDMYTEIMFGLKSKDKNYKIYSIGGLIKYEFNISDCYNKKDEIQKEVKDLFPKAKISHDEKNHVSDRSGKSKVTSAYFDFDSGDYASIECYDWSKEMGYWDNFRIAIISKQFGNWLTHEAYK